MEYQPQYYGVVFSIRRLFGAFAGSTCPVVNIAEGNKRLRDAVVKITGLDVGQI
jgi:hypothetical protein